WRKAARLLDGDDANGARALRVDALLAESSLPALTREGRQMLLTSALRLAPEDERVAAALVEARQHPAEATLGAPRWTPVAGMAFGLWGLGAIGSWRRRRSRRT
nr:hypothetical protein [Deltaproteobacteria bacterium]